MFIGGPPHSGKSHLTNLLDYALRERNVEHYLERASPDGEGAWFYTIDQQQAIELRNKARAPWTPMLAEHFAHRIRNRQLGFLVDVGGRITPEVETIARCCTHAVLIAADPDSLVPWRSFVKDVGLELIADLHSDLSGIPDIVSQESVLCGSIHGLCANGTNHGPCFEALVERMVSLFSNHKPTPQTRALRAAQYELVLNLETLLAQLRNHTNLDPEWQPEEIVPLLESLPNTQSTSVFGRAPNWLYAALAAHIFPFDFEQFDVRLGWVVPPVLQLVSIPHNRAMLLEGADESRELVWKVEPYKKWNTVSFSIPNAHLSYATAHTLTIPDLQDAILLDGKLPFWLWTALVRSYATAPAIAIRYPQRGNVVIQSSAGWPAIGTLLPFEFES